MVTSVDLEIEISNEIKEVQILCDLLQIDSDLPQCYRGKNIFIFAEKIQVMKESTWDLSGINAHSKTTNVSENNKNKGKDGDSGQNGGNLKVYCDEIINSDLWKIVSNGGNGSDGQNGSDGENGSDGINANIDDFKILGEKITSLNYLNVLSQLGFDIQNQSQCTIIYEDGKEKIIIFDHDSQEMLMLVKGSKGHLGALGEFGGRRGRGGHAGKLNVKNLKFSAKNGEDGNDGMSGFNGQNGKDGKDIFMIIRNNESDPIYVGLADHSKFKISKSNLKRENSIFFTPSNKFIYVKKLQETQQNLERIRNTLELRNSRAKKDEQIFEEILFLILLVGLLLLFIID